MRKLAGWICYAVGGAAALLGVQLVVGCELLGMLNEADDRRLGFWDFLFVTSGHHRAYPNGYLVHLMRDLFVLAWAFLVIRVGREQFTFRESTRRERPEMVTCPECHKKTYPDAYCRFCGFNLVTHQPSLEDIRLWPVWKLSLIAYSGISLFLLVLNLMLVKTH
jgi:hypothetical protein